MIQQSSFGNATEAFEYLYDTISENGVDFAGAKAMFNVGFYIQNSVDRLITTDYRNFSPVYAEREWEWYMSRDKNAEEISQFAPIWKNHMNDKGEVNSNYGHQVMRSDQWNYVREKLKQKDSRHGVLTIYDGKEHEEYAHDTPCTLAIHFQVVENKLCMSVIMRSNDVWYGFCNDQYCFSKFQEQMANELGLEMGWYYHFASNMHIYYPQLGKNDKTK